MAIGGSTPRSTDFLLERWRQLWQDHRAGMGRFYTLSALFPGVLAAAFIVTVVGPGDQDLSVTASPESDRLESGLNVLIAFAPTLSMLWWGSIFSFLAVTNIKRGRILLALERELVNRSSGDGSFLIIAALESESSHAVLRVTQAYAVVAILVGLVGYGGTIFYAMARTMEADVSVGLRVGVMLSVIIAPIVLTAITVFRAVYYMSARYATEVLKVPPAMPDTLEEHSTAGDPDRI